MKFHRTYLCLPIILAISSGCSKLETARAIESDKQVLTSKKTVSDAEKAFLLNPYFVLYSNQTVSPSEAEFADWKTLRRGETGAVIKPLDPIYFDYTNETLDAWASSGDPIAKYIKAYKIFNSYGCAKEADVKSLLLEAYAVGSDEIFTLEGVKKPLKRVPEAAMVIAAITEQCEHSSNLGEIEKYKSMARLGGWYVDLFGGRRE